MIQTLPYPTCISVSLWFITLVYLFSADHAGEFSGLKRRDTVPALPCLHLCISLVPRRPRPRPSRRSPDPCSKYRLTFCYVALITSDCGLYLFIRPSPRRSLPSLGPSTPTRSACLFGGRRQGEGRRPVHTWPHVHARTCTHLCTHPTRVYAHTHTHTPVSRNQHVFMYTHTRTHTCGAHLTSVHSPPQDGLIGLSEFSAACSAMNMRGTPADIGELHKATATSPDGIR